MTPEESRAGWVAGADAAGAAGAGSPGAAKAGAVSKRRAVASGNNFGIGHILKVVSDSGIARSIALTRPFKHRYSLRRDRIMAALRFCSYGLRLRSLRH